MTFGEKLQKLIDARGYTITYVADCIGISDRSLRNWIHSKMRPQKPEYIGKLCELFRVSENYFIDDDEFDPVHILNKVKNIENRLSVLEKKIKK